MENKLKTENSIFDFSNREYYFTPICDDRILKEQKIKRDEKEISTQGETVEEKELKQLQEITKIIKNIANIIEKIGREIHTIAYFSTPPRYIEPKVYSLASIILEPLTVYTNRDSLWITDKITILVTDSITPVNCTFKITMEGGQSGTISLSQGDMIQLSGDINNITLTTDADSTASVMILPVGRRRENNV